MNTEIALLKKKFLISNESCAQMARIGELLQHRLDDFVHDWYEWLMRQEEFLVFFGSSESANLRRAQSLQKTHWMDFFKADITEDYVTGRRHVGAVHARIELPNEIYFAGMSLAQELIVAMLSEARLPPAELEALHRTLSKHIMFDTFLVVDEIARIHQQKLYESTKALMEMSTPVTPIWDGILLLPLLGIVDSVRTQDIMNKTLYKIAETSAKVFVMDISGVAAVDTAVANQLIKITKATRLMGCKAIISGISPAIARTLVELGVSVGDVKTTATLRDAVEWALIAINAEVTTRNTSEH